MHVPDNGAPRHEVYCSGVIAKNIRNVHRQARQEGRGKQMRLAFRQAIKRLRDNPQQFGEELHRLPALRMKVCVAVLRPIAIQFAVCTDRPMVFIKDVQLLGK